MKKRLLVVWLLASTLPLHTTAQRAALPSCVYASPGTACTTTIWNEMGSALDVASRSAGEALGTALAELRDHLQQSRGRLREAYRVGSGIEAARTELDVYLTEKDYYLCLVNSVLRSEGAPRSGTDAIYDAWGLQIYKMFADLDGGIPAGARAAFSDWTSEVKQRARTARSSTPSGFLASYQTAMSQTIDQYRYYVVARNLTEYAALGLNPAENARDYLRMILILRRPWASASTPNIVGPDFREEADRYYEQLAAAFGPSVLSQVSARLFSAAKDRDGFVVLDAAAGRMPPWRAFSSLLGESAAKPGLALLAIEGGTIQAAQSEYTRLGSVYGGEAVDRAAVAILKAPRRTDNGGELDDPRLLGAMSTTPLRAFEEVLKARVAGGGTAPAGELVASRSHGAWSHFSPGTAAVTIQAVWRRSGDTLVLDEAADTPRLQSYVLKSVDPAGASFDVYDGTKHRDGWTVSRMGTAGLPARIPTSAAERELFRTPQDFNGRKIERLGESTGRDTLELNGKVYSCEWHSVSGVVAARRLADDKGRLILDNPSVRFVSTTWTSEDAPGGLVLAQTLDDTGRIWAVILQAFQVTDSAGANRVGPISVRVRSLAPASPLFKFPSGVSTPAAVESTTRNPGRSPEGVGTSTAAPSPSVPVAPPPPPPAPPQDRCARYAQRAVEQFTLMSSHPACRVNPSLRWQNSYANHYGACRAVPQAQIDAEEKARDSHLTSCGGLVSTGK